MAILVVNAGSSSVRLAIYRAEDGALARIASDHKRTNEPSAELLRRFIGTQTVEAVAHRVVHGGALSQRTARIDPAVERAIEQAGRLAPLHNPIALDWIRISRRLFEHIPHFAVFDTALYAELPPVASTYALPHALGETHGIRRYGFHGLAHGDMWRVWREARPDLPTGGRVITFQLGAGCSVTAFRDGRVLDTSMGFSPLEGLMMATRTGDIDPGVLLHLQRTAGLSVERLDTLLNRESGLLGVSGESADMRQLLASSNPRAALAVELFCYRARKYLGAYLAVLGGADGIVFGGGIGENAPEIRERILHGFEWAGLTLDTEANRAAVGERRRITHSSSRVQAWVVPVDEMTILAEAVKKELYENATQV